MMDDNDFDQVGRILFDGVESIEKHGCPGTLIPLTNDTRAVLAGNDSNNVIIVAAKFGNGRCLIFSHNAYPYIFINVEEKNKTFIENCRRWLSRDSGAEFCSINEVQQAENIPKQEKILVWDGHHTKNEVFMDNLLEFLRDGGGLVCGTTAWGWLQCSNGLTLEDFPFNHFCKRLGVKVTGNYSNASNPIVYRQDLIEFRNVQHTIDLLLKDPNNVSNITIIGSVITEIGDSLPGIPIEMLNEIVVQADQHSIPGKCCPIREKQCQQQVAGVCGIMCAIPGLKAPGIHEFPGDFEQTPPLEANVLIDVKNSQDPWHSTGYYAVAGVPVQIEVLEKTGPDGWSIRIGCHSDNLTNCSEYRRWPCISLTKSLNAGKSIEMHSPYGGLIFLEPPSDRSGSIRVQLNNVALTPSYELDDPNRAEHWQHACSNAAGLWANIAGRHICFNLPSKSVLHMNDEQIDRVLAFWDSVILSNHELRGTKPERRERIVCDEQPCAGYMHSGYPIVTHMDVTDPSSDGYIFNYEKLEQSGSWGLFHELGHNMQRGWWTFSGTGEVTVNIFTLHAMETVCNKPTWIHSWLENQIPRTRRYIERGSNFDDWKNDPGVALFIYAQLVREFGWDSYKKVFRKYEEQKPQLNGDEQQIDYWIMTFSKEVEQNLVPLFKFWGFPISPSIVIELEQHQCPKIVDDFIEIAPERYTV